MPFYFPCGTCADETSRNLQELAEHEATHPGVEPDGPVKVRFVPQVEAQRLRREAAATR